MLKQNRYDKYDTLYSQRYVGIVSLFKTFHATGRFLYSENIRKPLISDVFRRYRKRKWYKMD